MVGTEKLSRVLWCIFLDIWFLVHLTINIFIFITDFAANTYFEHKPYKNAILLSVCGAISELIDNKKRI